MNQYVFKRYELKYILTLEKYKIILDEIKKYLILDEYKESTIQSLYYDTDTYRIIRNSMESNDYKEKLRIRSYGLSTCNNNVFLELKKKSEDIVFKRRIEIKEKDINDFILGNKKNNTQIEKEILYFFKFYRNLKPKILLIYDREAYKDQKTDLRITFDRNTRYRVNDLNLNISLDGENIFSNNEVLMEVKTSLGFPMWLVKLLNENKLYKTKFSKYAYAYQLELKKVRKR